MKCPNADFITSSWSVKLSVLTFVLSQGNTVFSHEKSNTGASQCAARCWKMRIRTARKHIISGGGRKQQARLVWIWPGERRRVGGGGTSAVHLDCAANPTTEVTSRRVVRAHNERSSIEGEQRSTSVCCCCGC